VPSGNDFGSFCANQNVGIEANLPCKLRFSRGEQVPPLARLRAPMAIRLIVARTALCRNENTQRRPSYHMSTISCYYKLTLKLKQQLGAYSLWRKRSSEKRATICHWTIKTCKSLLTKHCAVLGRLWQLKTTAQRLALLSIKHDRNHKDCITCSAYQTGIYWRTGYYWKFFLQCKRLIRYFITVRSKGEKGENKY